MKTKKIKTRKFRDYLSEKLQDPVYARAFFDAALQDFEESGDKDSFYGSIRNLAEAHGGVRILSKKIGVSPSTLYKILSEKGNPSFAGLYSIIRALGITLRSIDEAPKRKVA